MITARTAVIYDLDSTIADTTRRYHLWPSRENQSDKDAWVKYSMDCATDTPLIGTVTRMHMDWPHYQIHICSGRMSEARELTLEWLAKYDIPFDFLKLRGPDENDTNSSLKVRYIRGLISQGTDVELAYDDLPTAAENIYAQTKVPVLGVNPFNPPDKMDQFSTETGITKVLR